MPCIRQHGISYIIHHGIYDATNPEKKSISPNELVGPSSALTISQKVEVEWVILKLNLRCLCNNKLQQVSVCLDYKRILLLWSFLGNICTFYSVTTQPIPATPWHDCDLAGWRPVASVAAWGPTLPETSGGASKRHAAVLQGIHLSRAEIGDACCWKMPAYPK